MGVVTQIADSIDSLCSRPLSTPEEVKQLQEFARVAAGLLRKFQEEEDARGMKDAGA